MDIENSKKKKQQKIALAIFIILLFVGLIGGMQNQMHSVILTWDPNSETDLAGYNIYFGNSSRNYHITRNVGNVILTQIDELTENEKWFFAVTAYDTAGNESNYSNEVWIIFNDSTVIDSLAPLAPYNLQIKEKF